MRHKTETKAFAGLVLGLAMQVFPHTASAASFDCEEANLAADEKVICATRSLNDADVKMATTFDILTSLLPMGTRGTLQEEQSAWLKKRQACDGNAECIRAAYAERLKQFEESYKGLSRPL